MGRGLIALGALLVIAGGGALGYALTRPSGTAVTPEASAAMASAVAQLDSDLRATRVAVEQRAKTLAETSYVQYAVGTDQVTISDMASDKPANGRRPEISFKPEANEALELVQVTKADGKPAAHVARPEGTERLRTTAGPAAELVGEQLEVSLTIAITPSDAKQAQEFAGYLTVRRAIALGPAFARLRDSGITGSFEIGGKSAAIGQLPAGVTPEVRSLQSEPAARLLVGPAAVKGGMSMPLVAGGAGGAGLGIVLIVLGVVLGRRSTARPAPPSFIQGMPTVESRPPSIGYQPTQLSETGLGVAAGTPSPVTSASMSMSSINPNNLGPGALIGRWEVVRRLGSGGMADVYLAQSKGEAGFEKLVAIKVMHSHLARNQRAVDHFLDEARLAARIHHPNVVGIQDLGKIGDDYVIVMDYVEGVDLERLLASARAAGRPVPLEIGLGVLVRICDGLHAAHTATGPDGTVLGIIHRDVKSANVLVSRQGSVKVVDFGIAKAATQAHLTVQGETKGTPAMMAPEQRVGEVVDVRADVYSVGAVGYELITGHAVNLDLAALAHLGIENWPHLPLPSSLRPNLPHELDEILLGAMAFERDRRPADCAVFGAAFEDVMKRHNLSASDKDIARWADSELRLLVPAFQGFSTLASKPVAG